MANLYEHMQRLMSGDGPGPVMVHALIEGRAACRFSDEPPLKWPKGHEWRPSEKYGQVTCPGCRNAVRKDG